MQQAMPADLPTLPLHYPISPIIMTFSYNVHCFRDTRIGIVPAPVFLSRCPTSSKSPGTRFNINWFIEFVTSTHN